MKFLWCRPAKDAYKQVSVDDMFNPDYDMSDSVLRRSGHGNTVTYMCSFNESNPIEMRQAFRIGHNLECRFLQFVDKYIDLFDIPRKDLYEHFVIPKRDGGIRPIDAPLPKLAEALRELKQIFEETGNDYELHHTNAFDV